MTRSLVAIRYAGAVMELAKQENAFDAVEQDFLTLRGAMAGSRDLRNLLASPIIDDRKKAKILAELFEGKLSPLVLRFIELLAQKGRGNELQGVVEAYEHLLDIHRNVVPAVITTAVALDEPQRKKIEDRLARISGQSIRPEYRIDPAIIGGFHARVKDKMIDASVQHQLDRLRETLTEGAMN